MYLVDAQQFTSSCIEVKKRPLSRIEPHSVSHEIMTQLSEVLTIRYLSGQQSLHTFAKKRSYKLLTASCRLVSNAWILKQNILDLVLVARLVTVEFLDWSSYSRDKVKRAKES